MSDHIKQRQAYMLKQIIAYIEEAMYQCDDPMIVIYDSAENDGEQLIQDIKEAWGLE